MIMNAGLRSLSSRSRCRSSGYCSPAPLISVHSINANRCYSMQLGRARPEEVADAVASLVKAAMLDMDIGVSVYIETLDELRRRSAEAICCGVGAARRTPLGFPVVPDV